MDRRKFFGLAVAGAVSPFLPKVAEAQWTNGLFTGKTITFEQDFSKTQFWSDLDMKIATAVPGREWSRGWVDMDSLICAVYRNWNVWKLLWNVNTGGIKVLAIRGSFSGWNEAPIIHKDLTLYKNHRDHITETLAAWFKVKEKIDEYETLGHDRFRERYIDKFNALSQRSEQAQFGP